jgi:hypothetical protein
MQSAIMLPFGHHAPSGTGSPGGWLRQSRASFPVQGEKNLSWRNPKDRRISPGFRRENSGELPLCHLLKGGLGLLPQLEDHKPGYGGASSRRVDPSLVRDGRKEDSSLRFLRITQRSTRDGGGVALPPLPPRPISKGCGAPSALLLKEAVQTS